MKYATSLSILLLFILSSCGSDQAKENTEIEEVTTEEKNEWKEISINESGFKLQMKIPSEEITKASEEVLYDEDLGELEVKIGNTFDLLIFEDESQMEMVKNEINNHPFYKVEIVIENDSSLLYRYYSEGGSKEQWHIYVEKPSGESTLLIRSSDTEEFSEYESKKMLESALSLQSRN